MPLEKLELSDIPVSMRSKIPKGMLMSKDLRREMLSGMPTMPKNVKVYEPKYYQTEGIEDITKHVDDKKSVIRTEGTGAGKTVEAILYCLERKYKRILFLSPTETLSRQTAEKFTEAGILARAQTSEDRWWLPDRQWPSGVKAIMCSEGTAIMRWMSADPEVIIIDEAHHCYTEEQPPDFSEAFEAAIKLTQHLPGVKQIEKPPRKHERFVEQWNEEWKKQTNRKGSRKFQSERRKAMNVIRKRYGYTQLASIALVAKKRDIHLVGFTATPWRLKDEEGFSEIWDVLSNGPQLRQLSEEGHLVPIKVHRMGGKIRKTGATRSAKGSDDFTPSQLTKMFEANKMRLTKEAIDWLQLTEGDLGRSLRTIIFCCNQKHAKEVADYAREKGRNPGLILSDSALLEDYLEIAETIEKFGKGELDTLVNVTIATEGVDIPTADCVMILRDTVSRALLNQMAGRVTRVAPNKEYGLVMDATGCVSRLDSPMVKRTWKLECRQYKSEGEAPTADCVYADCFVRVHPASSQCWNCLRPQYNICSRCKVRSRGLKEGGICWKCKETDRQLGTDVRSLNRVNRDEFEGEVVQDTATQFPAPKEVIKAVVEVSDVSVPEVPWVQPVALLPAVCYTPEQKKLIRDIANADTLQLDFQKKNFKRTGRNANYLNSHFYVQNILVHFEIFKSEREKMYRGRILFPQNSELYVRNKGLEHVSNSTLLKMQIDAVKPVLFEALDKPTDLEEVSTSEWD